MRDFRDAKAMAHTLRAALAAKGIKITNSQSLELMAEAFGATDWNTLAAAIRAQPPSIRNNASPPPTPPAEGTPRPRFSAELASTLHRAYVSATQRKHEYATLEHLLLALTDDADALAVMTACDVDLGALKDDLASHLDNELTAVVINDSRDSTPTVAFQRVSQRAVLHVQGLGGHAVTGAQLLVAIFAETRSPAARLLDDQGMTRQDAVNFISHGIIKGSGGTAT